MRLTIFVTFLALFISACAGATESASQVEDVLPETDAVVDAQSVDATSENVPTVAPTIEATDVPDSDTEVVEPVATVTLEATPTAIARDADCNYRDGWEIYVIKGGDTLWELAEATGTTVDALKQANCMTDDVLTIHYRFRVPRQPDAIETP